jgi:hypothetical protein
MRSEPEFFVGFLPVPPGLKKTIRRVAAGLAILAVGAAAILVAGQHPFAASTFEFQQFREFRGVLLSEPYPALAISGQGLPWLLVGPGKHGPGDFSGLYGREVRLKGERIFRGGDHMIEFLPGSLAPAGPATAPDAFVDLGRTRLTGEVVDSKCYFGVMNPGNGKVHRDCAVRCISGGIPPAFLVRDAAGRTMTLLLANWKRELLDHIAEPLTIQGRMVRSHGRLILYAE